MKTVELPKRVKGKRTVEEYIHSLEELGYRHVGDGFYSEVLVGKNDVIKLAYDDPAYDDYLRYVLANQNNPYFPKIYSVHRYKDTVRWESIDNKPNITVVKMERLQYGTQKQRRFSSNMMKKAGNDVRWQVPLSIDGRYERQAAKVLGELFTKHREDLHTGNVMFRNGHTVIIDPVAPAASSNWSFFW